MVRTIGDEVAVMKDGTIREYSGGETVFRFGQDDYTRQLLATIPDLRPGDFPPRDAEALGVTATARPVGTIPAA